MNAAACPWLNVPLPPSDGDSDDWLDDPCPADASAEVPAQQGAALAMPGMPVVVTGLIDSPQFNGCTGVVCGPAPKLGRLAVLLDGNTKPTSIRETNLRKDDRGVEANVLGDGRTTVRQLTAGIAAVSVRTSKQPRKQAGPDSTVSVETTSHANLANLLVMFSGMEPGVDVDRVSPHFNVELPTTLNKLIIRMLGHCRSQEGPHGGSADYLDLWLDGARISTVHRRWHDTGVRQPRFSAVPEPHRLWYNAARKEWQGWGHLGVDVSQVVPAKNGSILAAKPHPFTVRARRTSAATLCRLLQVCI